MNAVTTAVNFSLIQHRGFNRIKVVFKFNECWNKRLQATAGARWSNTLKCWHIPDTYENRLKCRLIAPTNTKPVITTVSPKPALATQPLKNNTNQVLLEKCVRLLELKGYSKNTIKTYKNELMAFMQVLGSTTAVSMNTDRVMDYLQYCHTKLGLSENTIHSRTNALKFLYEQLLHRERFFVDIPRPKKHLQMPRLLNELELARLFNALANKKHKAMLFTAYSAGLRVSELVNLKLCDIDSGRMQIFVERSKGKKDRYVNLSPVLLDILRKYIAAYKPRPLVYLFESEQTKTAYPTRTVQQIFSNAKSRAGIAKAVGVHSLRHSFATHLLDKGTDIRYIKDLLGHFNIKTTERYLHVSKKQLINVVSPLDDLWRKQTLEW